MKKPLLLAPCGSFEALNAAISAGADYVIVGRAIYKSDDPSKVAGDIADEIRTVL